MSLHLYKKILLPEAGLEPGSFWSEVWRSTNWVIEAWILAREILTFIYYYCYGWAKKEKPVHWSGRSANLWELLYITSSRWGFTVYYSVHFRFLYFFAICIKFIHLEKATKFCEISTLLLPTVHTKVILILIIFLPFKGNFFQTAFNSSEKN